MSFIASVEQLFFSTRKKLRNANTAVFFSSFPFQSPSKPSLTLPAVWIWTLLYISILLVIVLRELATCSATKNLTKKQECGVDKFMKKFMHLPFLIKLSFSVTYSTDTDLQNIQDFCLHRCTYNKKLLRTENTCSDFTWTRSSHSCNRPTT